MAASQVKSANIVKVRDYGQFQSLPYIVMDYLEGHTLAQEIRSTSEGLPRDRVLEVFEQVASGLKSAHAANIVHRDLSPANIFIISSGDEKGTVKILDFGLAKLFADESGENTTLTSTGRTCGTPAYMSPEQCRGQPVTPQSDIYSLGCCMYEAIASKKAFPQEVVFDCMVAHVEKPPPPLPRKSSGDAELQYLVSRCLEKSPNRRPSAEELSGLISSLRAGRTIGKQSFGFASALSIHKKRILLASVLAPFVLFPFLLLGWILVPPPPWQEAEFDALEDLTSNNLELAEQHQRTALRLAAEARQSPEVLSQLHSELGQINLRQGNFQGALRSFEAARVEYEKLGQRDGVLAAVYDNICRSNLELGQDSEAVKNGELSLTLMRTAAPGTQQLADCLQQLSSAYERVGRSKDAETSLEEALAIDRSSRDSSRIGTRLQQRGDLFVRRNEFERAASSYQESLQLMKAKSTEEKLARVKAELRSLDSQ